MFDYFWCHVRDWKQESMVNYYTITSADTLYYCYQTSVPWRNHATVFCTVGFFSCGCVSVRLYDDRCSSNLTLHKDHKSLVCRTISDPHPRFCPLPTFTTPNSQPISGWGNIYRPICSTAACGQAGGRYGGLSFDAETTNVSEQKLVT